MPFNRPYRSNLTAGDLIYGLATARPKLVMRLGVDILTVGGPVTVDQYRTRTMKDLTDNDREQWKQFLVDNNNHPRYGHYRQAIGQYKHNEDKFAKASSEEVRNAAWRAKSKFGLEWTISNQRGHIHFMLDQIDMAAVVTKTHSFVDGHGTVLAQDTPQGKAPNGVGKERTVTHSELRWIYRNRNNALVQARIQFWMTTAGTVQPCGPPWLNTVQTTTMPTGPVVTWQQAWLTYVPTAEPNTF